MSSILKALRRVEDEVAEAAARNLREEVLAPARAPRGPRAAPRRRGARLAAAVLAVLSLLAAGALLGRWLVATTPTRVAESGASSSAPAGVAAAPPAGPAAPAPGVPSAPDDGPPPLGSPPSETARAAEPPVLAVVAPPLPAPAGRFVDVDDEPARAAPEPARPEPAASGRDRFLEQARPVTAPASREAAPRVEPAPGAERAPAKVAAAPQRRPAPRPAAPSAPRVESTVWHPDSERRRAVIESAGGSREVREGETVGAYLVLAIGPTGVVFRRDGSDVTRRVGER